MLGVLTLVLVLALVALIAYFVVRTVLARSAESRAYKRGLAFSDSGEHGAALRAFFEADALWAFNASLSTPTSFVNDLKRLSNTLVQIGREAQRLGKRLDISSARLLIDQQIAVYNGKANLNLESGNLKSELEPEVKRLNQQLRQSRAMLRSQCGRLIATPGQR